MRRTLALLSVLSLSAPAWAGDPTPAKPPAATAGAPAKPAPAAIAGDPAKPADDASQPADDASQPADEDAGPAPSTDDGDDGEASSPQADSHGDVLRSMDYASTVSGSAGGSVEPRSYAKNWMVAPPGWNLGGELRFITATTAPNGEPRIRFNNLALLRFHSRMTVSRRIELSGAIDLLSKQPDARHDTMLQGGSLGMKIATSRATAIAAGISGGPTMGDDGFWGSVATGAIHRSRIEDFLAFQVGGGAVATGLRIDELDPIWQADLDFSSELVLHTPRGEVAMWAGVEMAFPVAHSSGIEPSSRLDVTVGTVFAAVKKWDLYCAFTLRDRGTTDLPETTLPIIDGGFDQRQVVFGITRRFTKRGNGKLWALSQ